MDIIGTYFWAYWPYILGALCWLIFSFANFLTANYSDLPPGAKRKLYWLLRLISFADKSGWLKLLKLPGTQWPKLPDDQDSSKKPTSAGTISGVILLLVVFICSCGTTTLQRLSLVQQSTDMAWKRGHPVFKASCEKEALKCRKEGVKLELKDCPGAWKCMKGLDNFRVALDTADRAVIVGTPLAATDDPKAADYLSAALAAYKQALAAGKDWGLFALPAISGGK